MKYVLASMILFLTSFNPSLSQWIDCNSPKNKVNITSVSIFDESIYLELENNAITRSSVKENKWTILGKGLSKYANYKIVGKKGNYLFCNNSDSLFRSSDNGEIWEYIIGGKNYFSEAEVLLADSSIYIARSNNYGTRSLKKSIDYGSSWIDANFPPFNLNFKGLSVFNNKLFGLKEDADYYWRSPIVSCNDTIVISYLGAVGAEWWISYDNGNEYTLIPIETRFKGWPSGLAYHNQELFIATDKGVFVSYNRGIDWTARDEGIAIEDSSLYAKKLYEIKGTLYVTYQNGKLAKFNDISRKWEQVQTDKFNIERLFPFDSIVYGLGIDKYGTSILLRGISPNLKWEFVDYGEYNQIYNQMITVNSKVLLSGSGGIYSSIDNGFTWKNVYQNIRHSYQLTKNVNSISAIIDSSYIDVNNNYIAIYKTIVSYDEGRVWHSVSSGDTIYLFSSGDYSYGFNEATNQLFRKNGVNGTWKRVFSELQNRQLFTILPQQDSIFAVTLDSNRIVRFYRSIDLGLNWLQVGQINMMQDELAIKIASLKKSLVMFTNMSSYHSIDNGQTWKKYYHSKKYDYDSKTSIFNLDSTLFYWSNGKMFRSIDYGQKWFVVDSSISAVVTGLSNVGDTLFIATEREIKKRHSGKMLLKQLVVDSLNYLHYCQGDIVELRYYYTGREHNDSLTVELSDQNGRFISPITLVKILSKDSVIIFCLPDTVKPGMNYRVRLNTSNPNVYLYDNNEDITINQSPRPTITGDTVVDKLSFNKIYTTNFIKGAKYTWIIDKGDATIKMNSHLVNISFGLSDTTKIRVIVVDSNGCTGEAVLNVRSASFSNINDLENSILIIAPNPTGEADQLLVRFAEIPNQDVSIELLDFLGSIHYSNTIQAGSESCSIPIQGLSSGMYMLRVRMNNEVFIEKVIVN